jgi:hypothetical protein
VQHHHHQASTPKEHDSPLQSPPDADGVSSTSSRGSRGFLDRKKKERIKKVRVKETQLLWTKRKHPHSAAAPHRRSPSDNVIKIFLLLLQPEEKIFELIQLFYSIDTTTVGDILRLVPQNATEPALGAQVYTGLARPPKRSSPFLDKSMLASKEGVTHSAQIRAGEVLIAVPDAYSARHMQRLSKNILTNPRIQKLLSKVEGPPPDPPASKSVESSSSSVSEPSLSASLRHYMRTQMESVPEEDVEGEGMHSHSSKSREHKSRQVSQVYRSSPSSGSCTLVQPITRPLQSVQHSPQRRSSPPSVRSKLPDSVGPYETMAPLTDRMVSESSKAEAKSDVISSYFLQNPLHPGVSTDASSIQSSQGSSRSGSKHTHVMGRYEEESVEGSYSSWSKSFESAMVSSSRQAVMSSAASSSFIMSAQSKLRAQKKRRERMVKTMQRFALLAMAIMMIWYWLDPRGYGNASRSNVASPLGFTGALQFAASLLCLIKLQRFLKSVEDSQCPFLAASSKAMDRMHQKRYI